MSVYALDFGTTRTGQPTHLYRMKNANGMEVDVTDLGASIVAVRIPSEDGELVDVALGYDDVRRYEKNEFAYGAIVGRCANRIANASFELDGRTYQLTANEGSTALHGGSNMWYMRLWDGALIGQKGERRKGAHANTVIFGLFSPDGDQGFPGEVDVRVTYRLTNNNELQVIYDAQPSVKTVVNLTNHTYWNLNGHASGSVLGHTLRIDSARYTPVDDAKIPLGVEAEVAGTPFDFRTAKQLGHDFTGDFDNYDHNWVLRAPKDARLMREVAALAGDLTSIRMTVLTDAPALQVYTAKEMITHGMKDGVDYKPYAGVALETQFSPDAVHHPAFAQPIYTPEEPFHSRTTFAFDVSEKGDLA